MYAIVIRFTLVSSSITDLLVSVEDEYTYFAENKPLLALAEIRLSSKLRNVEYTAITNSSG